MGGYGSGKGIRPNRHRRKRFTHDALRIDSFSFSRPLKGLGLSLTGILDLETQSCHFGGTRSFWRCPHCKHKFRYLYFCNRRLECRKCLRLAYKSQNETLADRLLRKRNKIREKIGGGMYSEKPFGMRWAIYKQLQAKEESYDMLATLAFMTSARSLREIV